jgi:FixJ family two-component response regulator
MSPPTVFVIDDDAAVRDSLALLLETAGIQAEACDSAEAFLRLQLPDGPCCLVLDINMPGMNGAELQAELGRRGLRLPIIFLTAHGDVPTTVRVMKAGAADLLTKPVDGARLLDRVETELERNRKARAEEAAR